MLFDQVMFAANPWQLQLYRVQITEDVVKTIGSQTRIMEVEDPLILLICKKLSF